MTDNEANLEALIKRALPDIGHFTIAPLTQGGSDRVFYRVRYDGGTCVLCMGGNREELGYYIDIGESFAALGIPVPKFIRHSLEEGYVLMEDAGELSLCDKTRKSQNGEETFLQYRKVLRELFKIQSLDLHKCPRLSERPFDYKYLRWETTYFRENMLERFCGLTVDSKLEQELHLLAKRVAGEPLYPMHRDFQSQNIFIRGEEVVFLDFQGARIGHLFYDVASLLKDPYVNLPREIQNRLLDDYYAFLRDNRFVPYSPDEFLQQFLRISMQRLMQALGAYGFLGLVKGKKKFLQYIPAALGLLTDTLGGVRDFPLIKEAVEEARDVIEKIPIT